MRHVLHRHGPKLGKGQQGGAAERGQRDWLGDQGGGPSEGMARAGLQEVVRTDRPFSLHLEGKKLPQASAAAIYLAGLPETADRGSRQ